MQNDSTLELCGDVIEGSEELKAVKRDNERLREERNEMLNEIKELNQDLCQQRRASAKIGSTFSCLLWKVTTRSLL